jgi:hypothetical protein
MNWARFLHKTIISAVKRVQFVSDRMSYILQRDRSCHIISLKVHAPKEDNIDYVKDSFYNELERVFDEFPKIPKILFWDSNAKVRREGISQPIVAIKIYTKLVMIMELRK